MANFNKVILIGNLTRDPQLSYLPSQTAVCEIGLAVNRRWRAQDGQMREEVCFIDCRAFGKQAETLNQYLAKGRQVMIEGHLNYDTWETQDGQKRSKHRVTIDNFQFIDGGGQGARGGQGGQGEQRGQAPQGDRPRPAAQPQPQQSQDAGDNIPSDDSYPPAGDDIPF